MKIRLRQVRERRLMTQVELAERAGLTEATINRIERGIHDPRVSTVRKLAEALRVEPEELIDVESRRDESSS